MSPEATAISVRGRSIAIPTRSTLREAGIDPHDSERVVVFEMIRYLAHVAREDVLATASERRMSVQPGMNQLMQLEEWNHPDVVDENAKPSGSRTFQQLASVLETGNVELYRPDEPPNTHWSHWPDGGTL